MMWYGRGRRGWIVVSPFIDEDDLPRRMTLLHEHR